MAMMKYRVWGRFLLLGAWLLPVLCWAPVRATGILYAKPGAVGDCGDWDNACGLQTALASAAPGDEIWAAGGTYKPTIGTDRAATFQLVSGVSLYGGFLGTETSREQRDWVAYPTILSGDIGSAGDSADNSYHVVTSSSTDETTVLDGFTVTGGNTTGSSGLEDFGGGMYNHDGSPTVRNVTFRDNTAGWGGGMGNWYSNPLLVNVTFSANTAASGAGMGNFESSPVLRMVAFQGNVATEGGGGMDVYGGSPTLQEVTFSDNSAGQGGGMHSMYSYPTLVNVAFWGNAATSGGGMFNFESDPTLANVTFSGNTADSVGGGMCNDGLTLPMHMLAIPGDKDAGLGVERRSHFSNLSLVSVTFSGNAAGEEGGALFNRQSDPALDNCVLWDNSAPLGAQIWNDGGTPTVRYSLVQGSGGSGGGWDASLGTDDGGNLDDNPAFVDASGADGIPGTPDDDLRLGVHSPAVDAGDKDALPADELDLDDDGDVAEPLPLDLDGEPRVVSDMVDMGAYETPALFLYYMPLFVQDRW
jgi:hypothetical protein